MHPIDRGEEGSGQPRIDWSLSPTEGFFMFGVNTKRHHQRRRAQTRRRHSPTRRMFAELLERRALLAAVTADAIPVISISPEQVVALEGDVDVSEFTFTVARSVDTQGVVTVDYVVSPDGVSPVNASDFAGAALPSGTITFEDGVSSAELIIRVAGDVEFEEDEGFTVVLANPTGRNAVLGVSTAGGTIVNDDNLDFGDLPAPYATLRQDGGAFHAAQGPLLGFVRDAESDGQATAIANGDDLLAAPDDEDGVEFNSLVIAGQPMAEVVVTASQPARLDAWIDFDGDGSFGGPREQIFASADLLPGANGLTFTVPADARSGVTFARFRLSSVGGLAPTGAAPDGEVEDYTLMISDPFGGGEFADSGQGLGGQPSTGVSLGDLDEDGDLDAFVVNDLSQGNRVWINDQGEFTDSGQRLGSHTSSDVALGDLDGDGDLDAWVINGDQGARVWLNDRGRFSDGGQVIGLSQDSRRVALGDIDSDGDLDAWIANSDEGDRLWLNDRGVFADSGQTLGDHRSRDVALGDVDGDGDLDALVVHESQPHRVWLNQGGVFNDSGQLLGGAQNLGGVVLADFDQDGDLDALIEEDSIGNRLWQNQGGVFSETQQSVGAGRIALGDLNGDGSIDVVTANGNSGNEVWLNSNGNFTDSGQSLGDHDTRDVSLGDFDGDGDLDLFQANFENPSRVWLDTSSSTLLSVVPNAASLSEGNFGTQPFTFEVRRAGDATSAASVEYFVTGSGSQRADTSDFGGSFPSGTVNFAAGQLSQLVSIDVTGDTLAEPDEGLALTLFNPTPDTARIVTATARGTIRNDDLSAPSVTLTSDAEVLEEAAGMATVTASLSAISSQDVTVQLEFMGTADEGVDYTATSESIVIPAGSLSGTITIATVQDDFSEGDETIVIDILAVQNANLPLAQRVGLTIDDDDDEPPEVTLTSDRDLLFEASDTATLTATLSAVSPFDVTVELGFSGTALFDADYGVSSTEIVIPAGSVSAFTTLTPTADAIDEMDETVVVEISAVTNGTADSQVAELTITDDFFVTFVLPTDFGFVAQFNRPLDHSLINLFESTSAGARDVTLVGDATGPVNGSMIFDDARQAVTFVKSGTPLAPDSYTIMLRSAVDGFQDEAGNLLDGDGSGLGGDNFEQTFVVAPPPAEAVMVGLPDFVRGPGQPVHLPAGSSAGIPVTLSDGANVRSVELSLRYDPALLTISGATLAAGMPAGATVGFTSPEVGVAAITFVTPEALPAGSSTFVEFTASVPAANGDETYRSLQLLEIGSLTILDANDAQVSSIADNAVHIVSYFGDVSGNEQINANDAAQVARFAALVDFGFAAFPSVDAGLLADISGNGRVNASDASLIAQFAALFPVSQIPPLPAGALGAVAVPTEPGNAGRPDVPNHVASDSPSQVGWEDSPEHGRSVTRVTHPTSVFDDDDDWIGLEDAVDELFGSV